MTFPQTSMIKSRPSNNSTTLPGTPVLPYTSRIHMASVFPAFCFITLSKPSRYNTTQQKRTSTTLLTILQGYFCTRRIKQHQPHLSDHVDGLRTTSCCKYFEEKMLVRQFQRAFLSSPGQLKNWKVRCPILDSPETAQCSRWG